MKLSEFILLDEKEKRQTVLSEGLLVGKRKDNGKMIFLFQLETFYVETYFNMGNKGIETFLIFKTTTPLEPYLKEIRIDDLLN